MAYVYSGYKYRSPFKHLDDDGKRQEVDAEDVNAYLQEITGREVTAKDFRTWAGTMLVAAALRAKIPDERIVNFMSIQQIKCWIAGLHETKPLTSGLNKVQLK